MFRKTLELQLWIDLCRKMLKNGFDKDFLEHGSKDFANIRNLNEKNDTLSNGSGPMFWKNLDHELWSDSG